MNTVILITGNVKFQINLDPSIWTFDERSFSLQEKFPAEGRAISLTPFFNHAEPLTQASKVICHRKEKPSITIPLSLARSSYACFAINDQPIKENGPIFLYYPDGSNQHNPIDTITRFEIV